MNILRKNPFVKFFSIILAVVFFCTSCYTTRTVNDTSRPIYETKRVPVYEEVETVEYRKAQSPVFRGTDGRQVSSPIHLAVLDFYSQSGSRTIYNEGITNTFYSKLLNAPDVWDKFQPYQPSTLKSMFSTNQLNAGNRALLRDLSNTNIPFAVSAELNNIQRPDFELSIYRTSNGISIYSHRFRTTGSSNAIDDAIRFLMTEELPYYRKENQLVRYETERKKTGYHKKQEKVYDSDLTLGTILVVSALLLVLIMGPADSD